VADFIAATLFYFKILFGTGDIFDNTVFEIQLYRF